MRLLRGLTQGSQEPGLAKVLVARIRLETYVYFIELFNILYNCALCVVVEMRHVCRIAYHPYEYNDI